MALTKVRGNMVNMADLDLSNVGAIQADSIAGDADTNTSITFSGSDVITIANAGTNQLTFNDGSIVPVADNDIDLGTSVLEFKDAFFDGTVTSDAFAGPLTGAVTGNADTATALASGRTIAMTGDVVWTSPSFDGSGNVTAAATIQTDAVDIAMLSATGTASSSTFLRGDNSWTAVSTPITALNNATANELVTVGSTTTELDAEANLTFDGSTLAVTGAIEASGTFTGGMALYTTRDQVAGALTAGYDLGYLYFGGRDSDSGWHRTAAAIRADVAGTWTSSSCATELQFATTAEGSTSSTQRMVITEAGKVGIGVTPTHHFNLQGTGTVENRFRSTDGKCSLQISSNTDQSNDSVLDFYSGTSGRGSITYDHHSTAASQKMIFKTANNGVTAMTILGDGNVGIGTDSPDASFHNVSSDVTNAHYDTGASTVFEATENVVQIVAADSGSNASALVLSTAPSSGDNKHWVIHHGGTSKSDRLDIGYAASSSTAFDGRSYASDLTILTSGYVGIGETTPVRKLVLAGSSGPSAEAMLHMDADTAGGECALSFKADSTNDDRRIKASIRFRRDDPGTRGTGDLHFCVNGDNNDLNATTDHSRMRIKSDGKVGIGTTDPGYQLDVTSSLAGGWHTNIENTASDGYGLRIKTASTGGAQIGLGYYAGNDLHFRIMSDGQVGIKGDPGHDFDVHGTSQFRNTMHVTSSSYLQWVGGEYWSLQSTNSSDDIRFTTVPSGGQEHFRIAANGDLTATDTDIGNNSDSRLKENIENYSYDINKFKSYEPRIFDWKNPEQHGNISQQIGFIAQEQEIIDNRFIDNIKLDAEDTVEDNPDIALIDEDRLMKTSKFGQKDAMYVSVIKQLITRLETAEAKIAVLEG